MSFSGFYQVLCQKGHQSQIDCFEYPVFSNEDKPYFMDPEDKITPWVCPYCNTPAVWWNLVDTTNGSFDENNNRIDGFVELEVQTQSNRCFCPDCGNEHGSHTIYKTPNNKGHLVNNIEPGDWMLYVSETKITPIVVVNSSTYDDYVEVALQTLSPCNFASVLETVPRKDLYRNTRSAKQQFDANLNKLQTKAMEAIG